MKKDLSTLTDDELLFESDEVRSNVSYYNAAEGDNWYREAEAREKAKQYLSEVWKEVQKRGLSPRPGNYLL